MPLPLIAGAAIAAGSSLLGGAINAQATADQNRQSQMWSERMYNRQYQDNLAFWGMQNEYNSPQAQMARFQEAGLNPNLIYGQGNSGNAGPVSTPDVQQAQFRTPEWGNAISSGGLSAINAIYDLDIKQATLNNLKAQNQVIQEEALLKAAQTTATSTGEESTLFKLNLDRDLRDVSAETRREQLRQIKTSTDLSINKDEREAVLNVSTVKEAAERIASIRLQRANTVAERDRIRAATDQLKNSNELLRLDIELRRMGINPNDPMWSRIVGRALNHYFNLDGSQK